MNQTSFLKNLSDELCSLPSWNLNQLAGKKAVILSIDMNNGFTRTGALSSSRVAGILPATRNFLKDCQARNLMIAAVTDCHSPDSIELASYPPHCMEDSDEPDLAPEICRFPKKILTKNSTNAFFAPGMKKLLDGADTVVVTGCCTDICIMQFANTLKAYANQEDLPLEVIVPAELVSTFDGPGHPAQLYHDMALSLMQNNGIEIVHYQPTK